MAPTTPSKAVGRSSKNVNITPTSSRLVSNQASPLSPHNQGHRVGKKGKSNCTEAITIPDHPHIRQTEPQDLSNRLNRMINLTINGPLGDSRVFQAHAEHLSQESSTLRSLIAANDPDATDIKYNADPTHFSIWMTWSYYKRLEYLTPFPPQTDAFAILLDLYLLGWRLGVKQFLNEVVKEICDHSARSKDVPDASIVNRVYRETPPSLPLRKLVVEQWCVDLTAKDFNWRFDSKLEPRFLHDCMTRLMALKKDKILSPDKLATSYYMDLSANKRLPSFGMDKKPSVYIKIDDSDDEEETMMRDEVPATVTNESLDDKTEGPFAAVARMEI